MTAGFCHGVRSFIFWDVIKHRLVISYRCFGTTLEDRTDRLSWKVSN